MSPPLKTFSRESSVVARKPQLLRKFFLLDSGAGLFGNLVGDRAFWLRFFSGSRFRTAFLCHRTRWTERSGGPVTYSLFFVGKTPDGPHQMGHGDVSAAFRENLRDPMDAQPATMRLQDLFLILSQCIDLGLLPITAAFRAAGDFEKILSSGFEMIRIRVSQCESPRVLRFMIKKGQIGDQIDDHNRGELRCHPAASRGGHRMRYR